jgi:hypothetical protein
VKAGAIDTTGKIVPFFFEAGNLTTQYWDGVHTTANGAVNGGSGTWDNTTTKWTDAGGATNGPFTNGAAIFAGPAGGTVILGAQIQFTGLVFNTDGYVINGAETVHARPAQQCSNHHGTCGHRHAQRADRWRRRAHQE